MFFFCLFVCFFEIADTVLSSFDLIKVKKVLGGDTLLKKVLAGPILIRWEAFLPGKEKYSPNQIPEVAQAPKT